MYRDDEVLEIYPRERNEMIEIWADIQRRYIGKSNDLKTLFDLKKTAEEEFANKLGIKVMVDVSNQEMGDDGKMYSSPVIVPLRRIDNHTIDHDRMAQEIRSGELDGIAGTIKEDGSWRD